MPDITMCEGYNCNKKETCYRFTAIPNEYRQSYFYPTPLDVENQTCGYFVENERAFTLIE